MLGIYLVSYHDVNLDFSISTSFVNKCCEIFMIYLTNITVSIYSPAPSPPYSTHSPLQPLPSVTEDDTKDEENNGM